MASPASATPTGSAEPLYIIKITYDGATRKFKFPMTDLSVDVLPMKMRTLLQIPSSQRLQLERFSDSNASFMVLDPANRSSYKQLARAAKAKGKLRMRATAIDEPQEMEIKPGQLPRASVPPTLSNILNPASQETLPTRPKVDAPSSDQVKPTVAPRAATSKYFDELSSLYRESQPTIPEKQAPTLTRPVTLTTIPTRTCWQVCCNNCDTSMSDVHYHCSICDGGDYDLCEACVKKGIYCQGQGHWLIKRFIKGGQVINSTTERVAPRPKSTPPQAAYSKNAAAPTSTHESKVDAPSRTCNSCVRVLPERLFVHCMTCPDFDLCLPCHKNNLHGHHPEHEFKPLSIDTPMCAMNSKLCQPGRNRRHWAICDSCEKSIFGVRHKCLDCPDFDFCNDCIGQGRIDHPHRFVKCYEPIAARTETKARHYGIYCDGPLCNDSMKQGYIHGIRYKCAICHDTDFCEHCEAHPSNKHNQSHPLIKIKTMIQGVKISTMDTSAHGQTTTLGDKDAPKPLASESSETPPQYTADAVKKVQVEEGLSLVQKLRDYVAVEPKSSQTEAVKSEDIPEHNQGGSGQASGDLAAHFKEDSVADGTRFGPQQVFKQVWTLYNPGPRTWPAGCSVRHIGGDYMLNVDQARPSSTHELAVAQETNVTQAEVPPHDTASFAVTLKTPARLGRHISYWRLKTKDGLPFGHKLWCDIQVSAMSTVEAMESYTPYGIQLEQQRQTRVHQALLESHWSKRVESALGDQIERSVNESKARHQKMREEQQTLYEHFTRLAPQQHETEPKVEPSVNNEKPTSNTQPAEGADVQAEVAADQNNMTESAMVFPKLDKESPAGSTHEDNSSAPTATTSSNNGTDKEDEVVAFSDSEDDDEDGFFTDEEYDILDASDEEIVNAPAAS